MKAEETPTAEEKKIEAVEKKIEEIEEEEEDGEYVKERIQNIYHHKVEPLPRWLKTSRLTEDLVQDEKKSAFLFQTAGMSLVFFMGLFTWEGFNQISREKLPNKYLIFPFFIDGVYK